MIHTDLLTLFIFVSEISSEFISFPKNVQNILSLTNQYEKWVFYSLKWAFYSLTKAGKGDHFLGER